MMPGRLDYNVVAPDCRHRDQRVEAAGRDLSVSAEQPRDNRRTNGDDCLTRASMPALLIVSNQVVRGST